MTREADNSIIEVEIFDQTFSLLGDQNYILKLAQCVDAKMRALAGKNPTANSGLLAVLAALNIADECHRLKAKLEGEERETSGEEVRLMTEEDKQRTLERRQRHHTRRWYEKQLLAIANDESVPAKERHEALFILGRVRGYHGRPTGKS